MLFAFAIFVLSRCVSAQEHPNSTIATTAMLPIHSPPIMAPPTSNARTSEKLHCPVPDDAVSTCEASNIFYYYECCGKLNMYCCMKFRDWFSIASIVVAGSFCVAVAVLCIRCFCCRARRSSSYDF